MTDPDLEGRLADLLHSTEGIREEIRIENIKRDQRIRLSRILIFLVLAVAISATFVAFSARHDLHASLQRTAEARIASCQQYNQQQQTQIAAEKLEIRQLTAQAKPGTERAVTRFLAGYDATVEKAHKPRDCTPSGIEKYLSTKEP